MLSKIVILLIAFFLSIAVNSQQICVKQECSKYLSACDINCQKQLNKCSLECTFGSQGCIQDCVSTNSNALDLLTCSFDKCINL